MGTRSEENQFRATLLGVLRMKILPTAAKPDPNRQNRGFPTYSKSRIHTPAITSTPPQMKLMRIPYLLSTQLQGKAKRGCAMVNRRAFRVTSSGEMAKVFSTMTLMLEKV
jgi:hypothetical protein